MIVPIIKDFVILLISASNIEKAKATCNVTLKTLNEKRYNDIKRSNFLWIERTENSTVADKLIRFVENFSW